MTSIATPVTADTTTALEHSFNQRISNTPNLNENEGSTGKVPSPVTKIMNDGNNDILNEFMVLSPVKIFDYGLSECNKENEVSRDTASIHDTRKPDFFGQTRIYEDKFTDISTQLTTLLGSLNEIYQKVGYSKSEIHMREKSIFKGLSSCLQKFHTEATREMEHLATSNELDEEILNRILDMLGDPSGLNTIPDLFVRNSIVAPKCKSVPQSPKKPLTLLNKRNLLDTAKKYVYQRYCPKLVSLLDKAEGLQRLVASVDEFEISSEEDKKVASVVHTIPSLAEASQLLREIREQLGRTQNNFGDTDRITEFIKKRKDLLLHRSEFRVLRDEEICKLDRCAELYRVEYESRLNVLKDITTKLRSLTTDLGIRLEDDMDKQNFQLLASLAPILNHMDDQSRDKPVQIKKSQLRTLNDILDHYTKLHRVRTEKIGNLWQQCSSLWNTLEVAEMYRQQFMADNQGFTEKVQGNLEKELKRLEELKKEMIKELIKAKWTKINELWSTLQISQGARDTFIQQFNRLLEQFDNKTADDEAILKLCENELERLNEKLRIYAPILQMLEEYKSLKEDERFLEISSRDSSRLLSRNSHKILLKEENIRKRLFRHLPRLLKNLKNKLLEAEGVLENPFMLDGEKLLDVISREEEHSSLKYPRSRLTTIGTPQNKSRSYRAGSTNSRNVTRKGGVRERVVKPITSRAATGPTTGVDRSKRVDMKYHSVQNTPLRRMVTEGSSRISSLINKPRQARSLPRPLKKPLISNSTGQVSRNTISPTRLALPTSISRNLYRSLSASETAGGKTCIGHSKLSNHGRSMAEQQTQALPTVEENKQEKTQSQSAASRTLSLLNMNQLNKSLGYSYRDRMGSKIPSLTMPTKLPTRLAGKEGKENERSLVTNDKFLEGNFNKLTSINENDGPTKKETKNLRIDNKLSTVSKSGVSMKSATMFGDPDRSIYRLMISPDGKFRLGVEQRGILESSFDDTSMFDE